MTAVGAPILGVDRVPVATPPGELLLSQLNCVSCHHADPVVAARLRSSQSPVLGAGAVWLTPQYMRDFLLSPHSEKPGTTMPDVLHGRSDKAEVVEALVHFLMSVQGIDTASPVDADAFKLQDGRRLYHRAGCVACHAPQEPALAVLASSEERGVPPTAEASSAHAALQSESVPFGPLAKKTTVTELAKFLIDPLKTRPSGRMPSLNLSEGEAMAIATYLLKEQAPGMYDPSARLEKIKGLAFQYFEDGFPQGAPDFDKLTAKGSGFIGKFSLEPRQREHSFGFRFSGFIRIEREGEYRFFCNSDDGSRLYIGDKLVVQNDGHHAMSEGQGRIHLAAGEHPIAVTYFNGGGEFGLQVSYQGPGIRKQEIPADVLLHLGQPMVPVGSETFAVDAERAKRGRKLFGELGCASCHVVNGESFAEAANALPALARLNMKKAGSCVDEMPGAGRPDFALSAAQRAALVAVLENVEMLKEPVGAKQEVLRTMAALNCYACHSRDGAGGPSSARANFFAVNGEADLGDEGRIPPHLSGVGAKLRPDWVQEVLWNRGTVRPYMATRMPQFGRANVEHLIGAFEAADSTGATAPSVDTEARRAEKFGRKLVGRDGLSCIACHTFGQFKSLGIPAMDLTQMTKRLKKEWFHRYLIDPSSLRPGTRMPSFWPEGVAVNTEAFGGDTARQIDAIWVYLANGPEAEVPLGLVQARMELVAEQEAIVYRNFIEGAGPRAIGIGYPEKANLAFDANETRWAMVWQGAFIDASMHRSDRGAGFVPPLGDRVTKMPPGIPFAILQNDQSPWPEAVGQKAGYEMRGYRLDGKRRPSFLYEFSDIKIEDYPIAISGELDPAFVRTLTLRSNGTVENLWFRAAVGERIEPQSESEFLVDGRLTLTIQTANGGVPRIRQSSGKSELIVPVVFRDGSSIIVEEIVW